MREVLGGGDDQCVASTSTTDPDTVNIDDLFKGLSDGRNELQHAGTIHFHDPREHWNFCPFCQLPFTDYDLLTDHVEDCHADTIDEVR